jgi:hypothetical protein
MPIVGGLDFHRKQITFDYLGTVTGQVHPVQARQPPVAEARNATAWLPIPSVFCPARRAVATLPVAYRVAWLPVSPGQAVQDTQRHQQGHRPAHPDHAVHARRRRGRRPDRGHRLRSRHRRRGTRRAQDADRGSPARGHAHRRQPRRCRRSGAVRVRPRPGELTSPADEATADPRGYRCGAEGCRAGAVEAVAGFRLGPSARWRLAGPGMGESLAGTARGRAGVPFPAARRGERPIDTEWLRTELGLRP